MNTKEYVLGFYEILKTPLEGKEVTMQKAKECALFAYERQLSIQYTGCTHFVLESFKQELKEI